MNIFLTLDYELFSSDTPGTPLHCIIEPMRELSAMALKYGVHYTIFVDAAYLFKLNRMKEEIPQLMNDFRLLVANIKELVKEGHDVQLHFHPQWIYTVWDENRCKWDMDITHFKLSDMEPELARTSFSESKKLLDGIIGYPTNCFRACGYCLDTYKDYVKLFQDNGITKDSSVARYLHRESIAHKYDYRIIPEEQIYRFKDSVKEKDNNGEFLEISISSFIFNLFSYRLKLKKYKPGYIYKDGMPLKTENSAKQSLWSRYIKQTRVLASLDGANSMLLPKYLNKAEKQRQKELIICGHPKNTTEESLRNLDLFLSSTVGTHTFLTTRDIQ